MEKNKGEGNEDGAYLCIAHDLNGQGSNLCHKNNQQDEFKWEEKVKIVALGQNELCQCNFREILPMFLSAWSLLSAIQDSKDMGMSLRGQTKGLLWHKRVPKEESMGITGFPHCSQKSIGSSQVPWGRTAVTELPAMCCWKCVTLTEEVLNIPSLVYRCSDWDMRRDVC